MLGGFMSCIFAMDRLIRTARVHSNEANRIKHPSNWDTTENRTRAPEVGSSARYQLSWVPSLSFGGQIPIDERFNRHSSFSSHAPPYSVAQCLSRNEKYALC